MIRVVSYVHRYKRPSGKLIHIVMRLLAALALTTTLAVAEKTVPGDRVYGPSFRGPGKLPIAELAYGGQSGRRAYRHGCLG
jgi:hypothetical protein